MRTGTTSRTGELRHNILSVVDAFAQSVALLSLALGVACQLGRGRIHRRRVPLSYRSPASAASASPP
jgi:hypothetical protein